MSLTRRDYRRRGRPALRRTPDSASQSQCSGVVHTLRPSMQLHPCIDTYNKLWFIQATDDHWKKLLTTPGARKLENTHRLSPSRLPAHGLCHHWLKLQISTPSNLIRDNHITHRPPVRKYKNPLSRSDRPSHTSSHSLFRYPCSPFLPAMTDTVDTGLLFVYAEPGANVSDEEFNDWYNIDHAPYRLTVPGFHTALRYSATDSRAPSYLALYDLADPSIPASDAYKALGAKATQREKTLVPKLANLNRSVFELISTTYPAGSKAPPSSAYPTPHVLVVTAFAPPAVAAEFNSWYEDEHLALLAKVPGLVRVRRYRLQSNVQLAGDRSATNAATGKQADPDYNYLALFDVERDDFGALPEFAASVDTDWSKKILPQVESITIRGFKLHTVIQKPE
ncbi:hypothetical protein D9619_008274 [Psilocybe cf. subviscida]|uniref:EthD domain-containing protein n=1 Tax=Psilocybe cf. subviscida TaxID=2480587 RepID=A0A8H5AUF8_9AGAR|nr:hypothetical protein D9619_008274 [Psilocybe cf. subviscida]